MRRSLVCTGFKSELSTPNRLRLSSTLKDGDYREALKQQVQEKVELETATKTLNLRESNAFSNFIANLDSSVSAS